MPKISRDNFDFTFENDRCEIFSIRNPRYKVWSKEVCNRGVTCSSECMGKTFQAATTNT